MAKTTGKSEPRKYPRSTAKANARRREILDHAAELFDSVGYDNTSVDDIALASGIGKSTLYHYFKGREEILFEMHEVLGNELISHAIEAERSGVGPRAELVGLMLQIIKLNDALPGYVRVFFEDHRELTGTMRRTATNKRTRYRKIVEGIFSRGAEAGEFRDVDPSLAAYGVLGMCNWTFTWFRRGGRLDNDELAAMMADLVLRGLDLEPRPEGSVPAPASA